MSTAALDVAEEAFYARCAADPQLVGAIGSDGGVVRIYPGWPTDTQQAGDYPRVTYFGMAGPGTGVHAVRIQVDVWAWPGAADPDGALQAIDGRLLELFDRQSWIHAGRRVYGHDLGGRNMPGPGAALRRMREFSLGVS